MVRNSLLWPVVVLMIGLTLTVSALARGERSASPGRMQSSTSYPAGTATSQAGAYPSPSTGTSVAQPTQQAAATSIGATAPAGGAVTGTPALAPTLVSPTPLAEVQQQAVTPTPTATLTLVGDVACMPGAPLSITGVGPPRAPILLYFGDRVVGGGSVEADGTFTLPLLVGVERPGQHTVSVQVRGSGQVLTEFTCAVPAVTPTPLPDRPATP